MPYTIQNPPDWLKNLPQGAIKVGIETFNRVLDETNNENTARQAAWNRIKQEYTKVGDKWMPKNTHQTRFSYFASVHSIEKGTEQNTATFYVLNTTKNRNGWGVTDKGLTEALPTLLGKSLNVPSNYTPEGHDAEFLQVGTWIKTEKPNGYALGTAHITDKVAWNLLSNGKIGPISVVITAYRVLCSKCNKELDDNWEAHECIKNGEAYRNLDSFVFDKVDFVDVPAFPQAGKIDINAKAQTVITPIQLCASMYNSQSFETQTRNGEKTKMSETPPTTEELAQRIAGFETKLAELTDKLAKAQEETKDEHGCIVGKEKWDGTKCVPIIAPEVAALQQQIKALENEKHMTKVSAAVEARITAGLATDKTKETERLTEFDDKALAALTEDANKIATKMQAQNYVPRYQNNGSDVDDTKREQLKAELKNSMFSKRLLAQAQPKKENEAE